MKRYWLGTQQWCTFCWAFIPNRIKLSSICQIGIKQEFMDFITYGIAVDFSPSFHRIQSNSPSFLSKSDITDDSFFQNTAVLPRRIQSWITDPQYLYAILSWLACYTCKHVYEHILQGHSCWSTVLHSDGIYIFYILLKQFLPHFMNGWHFVVCLSQSFRVLVIKCRSNIT